MEIFKEERFGFIRHDNMAFIKAFDQKMEELGYGFNGKIGDGYCWGKYMIIYRKTNAKSEKVYARIYIRESSILLRLFLNQIDHHRQYIENAPLHIKQVFTGSHGDCEHCKNEKDGQCKFRKSYTLEDRLIEKCNGIVFEFGEPNMDKLSDYLALFTEFYPKSLISR